MELDIYNNDAFSLVSLTALINAQDHIPGRAGDLAFAGAGEGVRTTTVAFEQIGQALSLIQSSPRGGPAPQNTLDKARQSVLPIPHIQLEETINADSVQNVRALGTTDQLRAVTDVLARQMAKQNNRHDLTRENLRLGALQGLVKDADGSTLANLFTTFNVSAPADVSFDDVFGITTEDNLKTVRQICQQITRTMTVNSKITIPAGAQIWAFCGNEFFDKLVDCTSIKNVWDGWLKAEQQLGGNYAFGVYRFADIMFENYRGTDDGNVAVGVPTNQARFFWTGVPGLYEEYYAPAPFNETVNTLGLPFYAKIAPSDTMNRGTLVHTETNPLPICLRPATLIKGVSTGTTEA